MDPPDESLPLRTVRHGRRISMGRIERNLKIGRTIHPLLIVASHPIQRLNSAAIRQQCSPASPSIPHASPCLFVPYWPRGLKENPDATSNSSTIDSSGLSRHSSGSPPMPWQNRHRRHTKTG